MIWSAGASGAQALSCGIRLAGFVVYSSDQWPAAVQVTPMGVPGGLRLRAFSQNQRRVSDDG
jgi:hypothetical protein